MRPANPINSTNSIQTEIDFARPASRSIVNQRFVREAIEDSKVASSDLKVNSNFKKPIQSEPAFNINNQPKSNQDYSSTSGQRKPFSYQSFIPSSNTQFWPFWVHSVTLPYPPASEQSKLPEYYQKPDGTFIANTQVEPIQKYNRKQRRNKRNIEKFKNKLNLKYNHQNNDRTH